MRMLILLSWTIVTFFLPLLARHFWWEMALPIQLIIIGLALSLYAVITYGALRKSNAIVLYSTIGIAVIFAQWALLQFVIQGDLGLTLIGESDLSVTKGVANFDSWSSSKIVRGYGPFEHPNVLGGTLLLNIGLLFHKLFVTGKPRTIELYMLVCLSMGVIVSFSRAAWLGLGLLFMVAYGRGIFSKRRGVVFLFLLIILGLSPWIGSRILLDSGQAVLDRMIGYASWWEIIKLDLARPIDVSYLNALVMWADANDVQLKSWEIDYVHSVPLLILAEGGVVFGGVLMAVSGVMVAWWLRKRAWWLVGIVPLTLFDHFFLTQLPPAAFVIAAVCTLGLWKMPGSDTFAQQNKSEILQA